MYFLQKNRVNKMSANNGGEKSDLRKFGITIGLILLILAGYFFWKGNESFQLFLTNGIIFFVLGIVIPFILKPIYWVWINFATILGWAITRIILSLMFYIIVTPIGVFLRLFGIQLLGLKTNHSQKSYWGMRTHETFNKKKYERQF